MFYIQNEVTGMYVHALNQGEQGKFLTSETWNAKAFDTWGEANHWNQNYGPDFVVVEVK